MHKKLIFFLTLCDILVVFELKLLSPIRRGLVHMGGKGYVNGEVCIEAEMLAHVTKDRNE